MNPTTITPRERSIAMNILNFNDSSEGYGAGSFFTALYEAALHADRDNLVSLQEAFPTEIAMFRLAREHDDGIDRVRAIAWDVTR